MYRYEVFKAHPLSRGSYGILAKEEIDGNWIAVAVAAAFLPYLTLTWHPFPAVSQYSRLSISALVRFSAVKVCSST